jgi:hypothetical protein
LMFLFRGSRVQVVISGERRSWAFHVVNFCDSQRALPCFRQYRV